RPADTAIVRAYNPSFDEHGWQSTHSVIEIVTDDMPFLVDSVIMELNRQGLRVHLIVHPIFQCQRDANGELLGLSPEGKAESFMHCQIDRQNDPAVFQQIEESLQGILKNVRTAVEDWPQMLARMREAIAGLEAAQTSASSEEIEELKAFLNWVAERNFIFLGYRDYDLLYEKGEILL
ncbi:MAG: NAD-glutamate dehydrogenase, partial [Candidatus Competibacteraceae bacterium]|nr:NAD-glutamate dehydrogenase [Candidatus Competibacteraceae bacterium]